MVEAKVVYNYLGKTGVRVSNLCLGTMTFGAGVSKNIIVEKWINVYFINSIENHYFGVYCSKMA